MSSVPPLNLDPLRQALGPNVTALERLVALFLRDTRIRADALRQALQAGDAPAGHVAAHTIKGAALNFRAEKLSAVAKRIETLLADSRVDEALPLLSDLEEELARVAEYLREVVLKEITNH